MIIQCPDCQTRFQLDSERVPPRAIRVRCSKCRYVFGVDGTARPAAPEAPIVASAESRPVESRPVESPAVETETPSGPSASDYSAGFGLELERSEVSSVGSDPRSVPEIELESPSVTATMEPEVEATPEPEATTAQPQEPVAAPEMPLAKEVDPAQKKARRLARALVSDILVYNREARDRALAEGTLVQALGQEIKKSWELYKEKVDPDFASDSNLFRDALNDILADGQKIF